MGRQRPLRSNQHLSPQRLRLIQGPKQGEVEPLLALSVELFPRGNRGLPDTDLQLTHRRRGNQQQSAHDMGHHNCGQPEPQATAPLTPDLPERPGPDQLNQCKPSTAHPTGQTGQGTVKRQHTAPNPDPEQG